MVNFHDTESTKLPVLKQNGIVSGFSQICRAQVQIIFFFFTKLFMGWIIGSWSLTCIFVDLQVKQPVWNSVRMQNTSQ